MEHKKIFFTLVFALMMLMTIVFAPERLSESAEQGLATLAVTANPKMPNYRLGENATISGSVTSGGVPANNLVVAVEVVNPSVYGPLSFRTISIGNPVQPWLVNITSIYMQDMSDNPIDTVQAGSSSPIQVGMNVTNIQSSQIYIYATITVYDASMVPIGTNFWASSVAARATAGSKFQLWVPSWASSGQAVIISCVYSKEPASGGIAYCPESALHYYLSRTQTGLLGITQPSPQAQTTPGVYADPITLPPDPIAGTYSVYVVGQSSPVEISSTTTSFTVENTTGIPPQASFVYDPPVATVNTTENFDASSSSPGGYNDVITQYDWNFGDGTPDYVTTGSPANSGATHVFTTPNTFIVTLNVTNNEGLWCTTSKPITVGLGYPPTANFTMSPTTAAINQTVTFDASASTPGNLATLRNYLWNFSDGTGIYNVTTSLTSHSFSQPGNYTVTLTVVDSAGRTATTSATLQVLNATAAVLVTGVNALKQVVFQGYVMNINVTVANLGNLNQTFSVTLYANTTAIATQTVTNMQNGTSTTLTMAWNASGFAKGIYSISATATNSSMTGGWVYVSMVGDLTGTTLFVPDGKVDGRDITVVAGAFGTTVGDPMYNVNCDLFNRGKVDGRDLTIVAGAFGNVDP
jgi:PKD repeat protein